MGFGDNKNSQTVNIGGDNSRSSLLMILLANTPQLLLSAIYFIYNNMFTRMLIAAEYTKYGCIRQPLRVTWPEGSQRSTHYLSIPYRYGIPLLVLSAALHWLVSQAFFYLRFVRYDYYGHTLESVVSTCGVSAIPILITTIIVFLMPCAALMLGLRQFKAAMPLARNCSAIISAACHPPPDDQGAHLKGVMWGIVRTGLTSNVHSTYNDEPRDDTIGEFWVGTQPNDLSQDQYYYCTFTSHPVVTPSS